MMMKYDKLDRADILLELTDQLWIDYESEKVSKKEYALKNNEIRRAINKGLQNSLDDLNGFAKKIGYVIIPLPRSSHKIVEIKKIN